MGLGYDTETKNHS